MPIPRATGRLTPMVATHAHITVTRSNGSASVATRTWMCSVTTCDGMYTHMLLPTLADCPLVLLR